MSGINTPKPSTSITTTTQSAYNGFKSPPSEPMLHSMMRHELLQQGAAILRRAAVGNRRDHEIGQASLVPGRLGWQRAGHARRIPEQHHQVQARGDPQPPVPTAPQEEHIVYRERLNPVSRCGQLDTEAAPTVRRVWPTH